MAIEPRLRRSTTNTLPACTTRQQRCFPIATTLPTWCKTSFVLRPNDSTSCAIPIDSSPGSTRSFATRYTDAPKSASAQHPPTFKQKLHLTSWPLLIPTPMALLLRMTNSPNLFDLRLLASMNVIDSFLSYRFVKGLLAPISLMRSESRPNRATRSCTACVIELRKVSVHSRLQKWVAKNATNSQRSSRAGTASSVFSFANASRVI